jgi:hypothetical protein
MKDLVRDLMKIFFLIFQKPDLKLFILILVQSPDEVVVDLRLAQLLIVQRVLDLSLYQQEVIVLEHKILLES